jgi:hypothetical protein
MLSDGLLKMIETRIAGGMMLLILSAIAGVSIGGVIFTFTGYQYLYTIPSTTYVPTQYFSLTQTAMPPAGFVLDQSGFVKQLLLGNFSTENATTIVGGGEAFEVDDLGNGTFVARIRDRGIASQMYTRPRTNFTGEGVVSFIESNATITSADVTDVEDALQSQFLTGQDSPQLDGDRAALYDAGDFDVSTATPGLLEVSVVPSTVAGQNFTYPVRINFGAGVRTDAVFTGPTPGTPGGNAVLDGDLLVPHDLLPNTHTPDFRGPWNALLNDPPLNNSLCDPGQFFYYLVSVSGNTTLSNVTAWTRKQLAVCQNGTWLHVKDSLVGVPSLFGRSSDVEAQLGDYPPNKIPFNGGTLADIEGAAFLVHQNAPTLTGAVRLAVAPGELTLTAADIGLAQLPFWNGTFANLNGVYNPVFDRKGRLASADAVGGVVLSVNNGSNVFRSGTTNVVLSLAQDIGTASDVEFFNVVVGNCNFLNLPNASGIIQILGPSSDAFMTNGVQTANSNLTFETTLRISNGQRLTLNDNDNSGSTRLRQATGASNLDYYWPPADGTAGQYLTTTSSGTLGWTSATPVADWVPFTPSALISGGTISFYNSYYRGSGAPGTQVEVVAQMQVNSPGGVVSRGVFMDVPVGTISGYTGLQGTIRGFLSQTTGDPFFGWVQDGTGPGGVFITHEALTTPSSVLWHVWFFYTVA